MITNLKPYQIIVIGVNAKGFHGAGAAGYAFSGTLKNDWRECPLKQAAIHFPLDINKVTKLPNKIGRWNEWGVARGIQNGYLGSSYGIETVVSPARARTPLNEIYEQLIIFLDFANKASDKEFLLTKVGTGYGGYSSNEMEYEWQKAIDKYGKLPHNIINV